MKRISSLFSSAVIVALATASTISPTEAQAGKLSTLQVSGIVDHIILKETLKSIEERNVSLDEMAGGPDGTWIVVANDGTEVLASTFVPVDLKARVNELAAEGKKVDAIAMSPIHRGWAVVAEDRYERSSSLPQVETLDAHIEDFINNRGGVRDIAFSSSGQGWLVVANDNTFVTHNLIGGPQRALEEAQKTGRQIREVEVTPDGFWLVMTDNWFAGTTVVSAVHANIEEFQREEWRLDEAMLLDGGSLMLFSHDKVSPTDSWIDTLEYDPKGGGNIFTLMERDKVPGVSIATIENGAITSVRSYGKRIANTSNWVSTETRFVIASITKNIVNTGIRILERDFPAKFTRDKDLKEIKSENPGGQLAKWINAVEGDVPGHWGIPEEDYEPFLDGVTANKIIQHRGGFAGYTPDPFWITPASACTDNVEPSQWLLGFNCVDDFPNDNKAVWTYDRFHLGPGEDEDDVEDVYATAGWTVLLAAAEDVHAGDAGYPEIWRELIFDPASMTRTTFDHNEINNDRDIAYIHNGSGVPRSAPVLRAGPGGGGLYSTAEDIAKYMLWLDANGLGFSGVKTVIGSSSRNGFGVNAKWKMNFSTGHGVVVLMNARGKMLDNLVNRYFVPESWTCAAEYYNDNFGDFCDCGCGAKDPDCESSDVEACYYCNSPGACSKNELGCLALVPGENWHCVPEIEPPPQWTCDSHYYDNNDGCDCGCGALDPDCADSNSSSCLFCNIPDSCADDADDCSPIDETENWKCSEDYCTPDCSGRSCGSDGCGGQCGACLRGENCDAEGQCAPEPVCAANPWEADVAYQGGDIVSVDGFEYQAWYWTQGQNPADHSGPQTSGQPWGQPAHCDTGCSPSCDGRSCGDDGCGGSCGGCDHGQACNAEGHCQGPSACEAPAWRESAVYLGGDRVSVGDVEYQAWYWTQGQYPTSYSGPATSGQPWGEGVSCL